MPRSCKSVKSAVIDTVLFFALIVLIGHLTINFWERYTIQSELTSMKLSLHTLRDTITNIGKAYDNLHHELKDLFKLVDTKVQMEPQVLATLKSSKQGLKCTEPHCTPHKQLEALRCKNKHNVEPSNQYETQNKTLIIFPKDTMKTNIATITKERAFFENKTTDFVGTKDATANTRNHPKSTGITTKMPGKIVLKNATGYPVYNHGYRNHQFPKHY